MFRKTTITAGLALVVLAFAGTAVSSAEWAKHTKSASVEENVTFTITDLTIGGSAGGITCEEAHSNATLTPGTTGDINTLSADPSTCKTEGAFAAFGCTITSIESTTFPAWVAHNTTSNIHITGIKIHGYMHGAFCPYTKLTFKGEATLTPDNSHHIGTGNISGTLEMYNGSSTSFIQNVSIIGIVHVSPSGTYGLTPTF